MTEIELEPYVLPEGAPHWEPPTTSFSVRRDVKVRMRDGVELACDLYRPDLVGPRPTIYMRTPYNKRDVTMLPHVMREAPALAGLGFAVVVQDLRGKWASEGVYRGHRDDGPDGVDTLDWIVEQEWSNGSVGTIGCSYLGEVQLTLAAQRHPAHKAAIVICGTSVYTPPGGRPAQVVRLRRGPAAGQRGDVAGPGRPEGSRGQGGHRGGCLRADPDHPGGSGAPARRRDPGPGRRAREPVPGLRAESSGQRVVAQPGIRPRRLGSLGSHADRRRLERLRRLRRAEPVRCADGRGRRGLAPPARRRPDRPLPGRVRDREDSSGCPRAG